MVDTQDFDDPYEIRIGIPTASWKYARPGHGFSGIVLPQNGKAYTLGQQSDILTGELLWWERASGERKPRIQQDFLLGDVKDIISGKPVPHGEWMSTKAVERFDAARATGEPSVMRIIEQVENFRLRRQIIKGESLETGMRAGVSALAATLGPKPVIAARITYQLTKLEPNSHGGETKLFKVTYAAPDDSSRAFVQKYLAATEAAQPSGDDPYRGATPMDDDPPF